tara:strand:- start:517 stop:807 length:291 start_codon:yes stop_codon:yes gene_type:complete
MLQVLLLPLQNIQLQLVLVVLERPYQPPQTGLTEQIQYLALLHLLEAVAAVNIMAVGLQLLHLEVQEVAAVQRLTIQAGLLMVELVVQVMQGVSAP